LDAPRRPVGFGHRARPVEGGCLGEQQGGEWLYTTTR
jgi:hypothetical protein